MGDSTRSLARRGALAASLALLVALPAASLGAQGTVGGQGFGYPPGQLGSRAQGTAGAVAEFDAETPLNPAALALAARTAIFFQYAPEFRVTDAGGGSDRTSAQRFPLVGGFARIGENVRIGLAISTLLDRTFSTRGSVSDTVNGEVITSTDRFRTAGGLADVRFAGSWRPGSRVAVGAAIHAITGENRIDVSRSIGDTLFFSLEDRTLSYSGGAVSAGATLQLARTLGIAASARHGTSLRARAGDTLVASARVPDRVGASAQYTGITGTTLAVRTEWVGWSAMGQLASSRLSTFDALEVGAGADVSGPRLGDRVTMLRAGYRWRELPFGVGSTQPTEQSVSLGVGLPFAYERSMLDLAVQRASRRAGDLRERAWILTLGVTVRP